ncbi:MAG TPA: hypothetical protein VJP85_04935 [Candidatus Baltobacteraceae bacterium]|nr:hypothetical protein [Candidatus Baltobacteraceae bacterium]
MLAGALFYIALIALVATTILSAGLAITRMTIVRMAQPYLAAGYQRALTSLQERVSAQMQSSGLSGPMPAFTPIPAACANAACTYKTSETIALTQTAAPTAGPSCDPLQSNCAPNVQANTYVGESRVTALVTVTVTDGSGSSIAVRSASVVLRTLRTPPYVAIAGSREGAFDDVTASHGTGDDGGAPPATPNPCASASPGVSSDTAVRVAYRNAATAACSDGSAWANASYDEPASSSGWGSR